MRAQTELPAVAIALVLLTGVLVFGVGAADSALSNAERPALEQRAAVSLSEQLTAPSANLTRRANVLDTAALATLDRADLTTHYGAADDHDIRIRLDSTTIVESGTPSGGVTIERLVLVERRTETTLTPALTGNRTVTLPQRATRPTVEIDPPADTTVSRLQVRDRVLLQNSSGLEGTFELSLSPYETTQLRFVALGPLPAGAVALTHDRIQTRKARLEVTVDA
ncbi:DUF7263 family protein [Halovenus halobia]|uniref:DUF7263 family protein n=1 Tax=Halovenus halobia TaxID=3396622 RepID=UPI003F569DA2